MAFRKSPSKSASTTTAAERAVRLLARREHSARELTRKLRQSGHDAVETSAAIDTLSRDHYQSDDRYAEALLRQRVAAGYGPSYIGAELQQNGISRERIRELLDAEDWRQRLADYVERKYGNEPLDRAKATKFAAALVRRGFAPDQVFRLPQMRRGGREDDA